MPQLRPLFVPGLGPRGGVGHASSAENGAQRWLAGEGTSRARPCLSTWVLAMAPQAGRPACPTTCGPRARAASEGRAPRCALPGTVLLLLVYLAYLALGTGVFWMLESPAAQASKARFKRDKWALLRNFTCLDGPALDSLIRVRGEGGRRVRRGDSGPGARVAGSISPKGWRR